MGPGRSKFGGGGSDIAAEFPAVLGAPMRPTTMPPDEGHSVARDEGGEPQETVGVPTAHLL